MKTTLRLVAVIATLLFLSACTTAVPVPEPPAVQRMYVIDCGENHAKDLSAWTTPADKGKPYVFSNNCYLIKHAKGWMLWDSGIPDRVAGMPGGQSNPRGTVTQTLRKPLVESLREVGVTPSDIGHFAMSHTHGDHSGNANLFVSSVFYIQTPEYDAAFGPEPQKYSFVPGNYDKLQAARTVKLNGDHDVFGDDTVVIKSTPGHTPGHQSLLVRLPRTGPVLLSGDFVHLTVNWEAKRSPSINYSADETVRSIEAMQSLIKATGAQLWINHDRERNASIPRSPAFVE